MCPRWGEPRPRPRPAPSALTGVRTHGRPHPRGVPSTDGVGTGEGGAAGSPSHPRKAPAVLTHPIFAKLRFFHFHGPGGRGARFPPVYTFSFSRRESYVPRSNPDPFRPDSFGKRESPPRPPPLLPPLAPTRSRRVPGSSEEPAPGTAPRSSASSRPAASPFAGGRVGKRDRFCPPGTPSGSGRRPEIRNGPGGLRNTGTQLPSRRLPRRRARPVVGDWEI